MRQLRLTARARLTAYRRRNWGWVGAAVALLTGIALLVGCGSAGTVGGGVSQETPGVTEDTIVVGTFMPLTGPAAAWGENAKGLAAYFKYLNDQGGVHGRKIQLIIEDDQYQPSRTVAAVKKLVEQDNVFAIVAPVGTSTLTAVRDYLRRNGVPVVAYLNGATKFSNPVDPLLFAGLMTYEREARILVKYAAESLHLRKLGVFYQNDDFGRDGLTGAKRAAEEFGLETVAEVSYNPADVDVSAHVLKLKESGAEGVLIWSTVKHAALLMGEAQKINYRPKWLGSSVIASTSLPELAGEAAEGAYFVGYSANIWDEDHPVVKEFLENYPRYEKTPINSSNLTGWAAGRIFAEAVRRAGPNLTREGLIRALETFDRFENTGLVTYTKDDHSGYREGFIRQFRDGKFVRITDWISAD